MATTEHQKGPKETKNSIIRLTFHHKEGRIATLYRQTSVWSVQNIYPSPAKFYTSAARTDRNN